MDKLQQVMKTTRGFGLIEVVVALVIFSLSVITIFQLITSTSVSIFSLEDRLLAKEVANNRMALINTLEKPINKQPRKGEMIMGGKTWIWEEEFKGSYAPEIYEFKIFIKNEKNRVIYQTTGYINE